MASEKEWIKLYKWSESLTDKVMFHLCSKLVKDFRTKPFTDYVRTYFKDYPYKLVFAEIGVHRGINAKNVLQKLNIEKMYLIDCWDLYPEAKEYAERRLHKYSSKIEFIKSSSVEASKLFPDNFFDVIYFDEDHGLDSMVEDFNCWYSKVKEGGVIGGHGYDSDRGVPLAVIEFCMKHGLDNQGYTADWWICKLIHH